MTETKVGNDGENEGERSSGSALPTDSAYSTPTSKPWEFSPQFLKRTEDNGLRAAKIFPWFVGAAAALLLVLAVVAAVGLS